jgi:SAM-dependent methyltransferase
VGQNLIEVQARLLAALADERIAAKIKRDYLESFVALGLSSAQARDLMNFIFVAYQSHSIVEAERQIRDRIKATYTPQSRSLTGNLTDMLFKRAQHIHSQLKPFLFNEQGRQTIDFGCGDGQVTQLLHTDIDLQLTICGVDVRDYRFSGVTIPFTLFNGVMTDHPNDSFEIGIMINVAHHEANNELVLAELSRIVTRKLVVVETVPVGESPEDIELDRERTFANDLLYNRVFHNLGIPVPGAYETPERWITRFQRYNWNCAHSIHLGFDQPLIRVAHHLHVFER